MPFYEFRCEKGHSSEKFYRMNDEKPVVVECDQCLKPASRVFGTPTVVPDFPEHFNISLGEVVKNRAHLRRIQKERGLQDYEKASGSAGGYDLVKDRLRRGA